VVKDSKCQRCLKDKKGCKFSSVENEEETEKEVVKEVVTSPAKLPVTSLKKILLSPAQAFHKQKEADLSPGF
jgi:hypothetical protein